jgi:hypothetical protein
LQKFRSRITIVGDRRLVHRQKRQGVWVVCHDAGIWGKVTEIWRGLGCCGWDG